MENAVVRSEKETLPVPLSVVPPSEQVIAFLDSRKYLVLAFCCLVSFANNYALDAPEAVYEEIKNWFFQDPESNRMNIDQFFLLLFVFYSIPNIFVPAFGGVLVDKLGGGTVVLTCLGVMTLGQGLITLGIWKRLQGLCIFARFLLGCGSEIALTSVSALITEWFALKHLNIAMALMLNFTRIGQICTALLSSFIALHSTVAVAFLVGTIVLLVSFFVSGVGLKVLQDKLAEVVKLSAREKEEEETLQRREEEAAASTSSLSIHQESTAGRFEKVEEKETGLSCSPLLAFPATYWVLVAQIAVGNPTFIDYCHVASAFYIDRECEGNVTCSDNGDVDTYSSFFLAELIISFAVFAPLVGLFIDKYGRRGHLALVGALGMLTSHLLLAFSTVSVFLPGFLLGCFYAFFFIPTWNSVAVLVSESHVGLAYGVLLVSENVGDIVVTMTLSALKKWLGMYTDAQVLFVATSSAALVCTISMNLVDHIKDGGILNRFASDKPDTFNAVVEDLLQDEDAAPLQGQQDGQPHSSAASMLLS